MRTKRSYLSVLVVVALLSALFSSIGSAAASPKESKMQAYVDAMQPGWNLGNTFDALSYWGDIQLTQDAANKNFLKEIRKQGFKSIRIPITWYEQTGGAPDYKINPDYMDRVQKVVDWSLEEGLYVMINLHHDSWNWINKAPANHDEVLAQYNATWAQIADRFKKYPDKLMFESINEPKFDNVDVATEHALLDEFNKSFFHIVRESGGKNKDRPLVLPTLYTNNSQEHVDSLASTIADLNDPNIIATIHFYGFWPFSINIAGFPKLEAETIKDIDTAVDNVSKAFVSKGIPVVVGEFGLLGWDATSPDTPLIEGVPEHGEMLKFIEYFTYKCVENKLTFMLWDNGNRFDRKKLQWNDPELYNMIMASLNSRSSTAESDLIFIKRGSPAQDTSINLNLNGNQFVRLIGNDRELKKDVDYTLDGQTLTLKAGYIARLIAYDMPREVAVLKAQFDKGADWTFHVLYTDTPVQNNAEGTTSFFVIPTAFNGDRLQTMEAVYADGGNAGPHNWTSYKEYARTYKPYYSANVIALTPDFFNEVKDGTVILKFHFWSGVTLEYTLTKNGTSITGKAS
ncbi:cellulase family glycosylhydrolase [Cohnella sp. CFH 77786]|uniref:cellulase family glycosylhydrolase n=1 Tax=Cohnella sp. CFH 77786 TaxID=2662265 RepID=UPI001C6080CE|nr:cellulase family glycosylhydrolase [Cohnella sp. CFH 77786]MBW5445225.1 cellulase family glycosylhydrolase [Cohnella sp. CFH 77786]